MTNGLLCVLISIALTWECRYAVRHNRIWIAWASMISSVGFEAVAIWWMVTG